VQFYTANFLEGIAGKGAWTYQKRHAFCLEPQNYPDSPNHPAFPSVVLHPGQTYKHTIVYRFSAR
jgi:aldose 1-epimerase